jgi:hypothetical protein
MAETWPHILMIQMADFFLIDLKDLTTYLLDISFFMDFDGECFLVTKGKKK